MAGWIPNSHIKMGQQFYELKWVSEKDDSPAINVITTAKYLNNKSLLFKSLFYSISVSKGFIFFCKKK